MLLSEWRRTQNFMEEFETKLVACTDTGYQDKMCVKDKKIQGMNRYSDILAYQHSRVKLLPRASMLNFMPFEDGYINANFVDGPLGVADRKIIASQGPLAETFQDFWRMVSQENVTLIVTTCNVVEKNRPKCHQFWPPNHPNHVNHWEQGM